MDVQRDKRVPVQAVDRLARLIPADRFIHGSAQAVKVGRRRQPAAAEMLFGGSIPLIDCLADHVVLHASGKVSGIPPVDQADAAVIAKKAVDRADIAVNIAQLMRRFKDLQCSPHDIERKGIRDPAAETFHIVLAGHSFEVFPDKIDRIVLLKSANGIRHAAGARELFKDKSFPPDLHETSGQFFFLGQFGRIFHRLRLKPVRYIISVDSQDGRKAVHVVRREFLDRDVLTRSLVLREIDRAEAAGPKNLADPVAVLKKYCILAHLSFLLTDLGSRVLASAH